MVLRTVMITPGFISMEDLAVGTPSNRQLTTIDMPYVVHQKQPKTSLYFVDEIKGGGSYNIYYCK